jgi:hypothetical protein
MSISNIHTILLGAGGPVPGLWSFDAGTLQEACAIGLPAGHTPYAIYIDPLKDAAAIGTREGRIARITYPCVSSQDGFQSLAQGAPVLSVCLVGNGVLVSSDTSRRTLLWNAEAACGTPEILDSGGQRICSLLPLPDGRLAGLSTEGTVRVWDLNTRSVVYTVQGPKPPAVPALVRMAYWTSLAAIVYPGAGGHLAFCTLEPLQMVSCKAHAGDFYVVIPGARTLYTVGKDYGLLTARQSIGDKHVQHYHAPPGIISGASPTHDRKQFLLVDERGIAALYDIRAGGLHMLHRLAGNAYRTAVSPSFEAQQVLWHRQREDRAQQLAEAIRTKIKQGKPEGLEALHRELVELGFEQTSLALRAEMAQKQQDIVAELRAVHQLAQTLRARDPAAFAWLEQYAAVLETTWQLREACKVYDDLSRVASRPPVSNRLVKAAEILAGGDWVAEPDIPMRIIVEASAILGKPLVGRWLIARRSPMPFREGQVTGEAIAAKYERVRTEKRQPGLPHALTQAIWWISPTTVEKIDTVLLHSTADSAMPSCQLAVQIRHDGVQPVLVLTTILAIPPLAEGKDIQTHNQHVLSICERVSREDFVDTQLQEVGRVFMQAVNRLYTQETSRWRNDWNAKT